VGNAFALQHKINVENRMSRIAHLKNSGIPLGKWDAIEEGTPEFEKLKLVQQERVLEEANRDFKSVVNRFEAKGVKNTKGH
jgi:hypothetical protein